MRDALDYYKDWLLRRYTVARHLAAIGFYLSLVALVYRVTYPQYTLLVYLAPLAVGVCAVLYAMTWRVGKELAAEHGLRGVEPLPVKSQRQEVPAVCVFTVTLAVFVYMVIVCLDFGQLWLLSWTPLILLLVFGCSMMVATTWIAAIRIRDMRAGRIKKGPL